MKKYLNIEPCFCLVISHEIAVFAKQHGCELAVYYDPNW